jgi:hypothetical protein
MTIARDSDSYVGLHDPMRLLRVLLRPASAKDLLDYGISPSDSMYIHDSPNWIS